MQALKIEETYIGPGHAALVIAEIGVNHDGDVAQALRLVEVAKSSGANAVKLQLFRADRLLHPSALFAKYQELTARDVDPAAMLRRYELSDGDVSTIVKFIREQGLLPIATPFSLEDVLLARSLDLAAIKIASPDLVNKPLLKAAAGLKKPLLVSSGAAEMTEVHRTVQWLNAWGAPFALLHCISSYPTLDEAAHLCWIRELEEAFVVPVGYSDHTTNPHCGALAVAAGARLIEKHITHDRNAAGPDHAASADPERFNQYVNYLRQAEVVMGRPGKRVLEVESDVRTVSRQSLVAARDIAAGAAIHELDLTIQRPGLGILASEIDAYIGRIAKKTIVRGALLADDQLRGATE